jgi:nucleoid-associated protein YgaU
MKYPLRRAARILCALALLSFSGCERLFDKGLKENVAAADEKAAAGDYPAAVLLYETAFDGTAKTADIHYKLALLYDGKLKEPVSALHHMERYLALAPTGPHAKEAKAYKKEAEARLLTQWSGGSPITQQDAVRLKNENELLREQLAIIRSQKAAPSAMFNAKGEPVKKPIPPGSRTHTVEPHETLGSIAQKYYKNKARWKDIQDANFNALNGTVKIKPGMTLIIP